MYRLRVLDAKTILTEGLLERIAELDEHNAQAFTEELQKSITSEEVYILVLTENDQLAGYLQYKPVSDESEQQALSSMKIDRRQGQSILISQLLLQAKKDLLRFGNSYAH